MAKQIYEEKKVIKCVGMLDKSEDGRLTVYVDGEEYDAIHVLEDMLGNIVSITSDIY